MRSRSDREIDAMIAEINLLETIIREVRNRVNQAAGSEAETVSRLVLDLQQVLRQVTVPDQ